MKKAIVVGATSGLGRGLAEMLAKNNYIVGITGRRLELLDKLKNENPEKYIISSFDVTQSDTVAENLNALVSQLGGLDLLILSSGTGDINKTLDFAIEKRTLDVNVIGFTAVADWSFNFFENQKFGQLAAISSIAGIRGNRHTPSYGATKAFQINYLEGLRQKATHLKMPIVITDIRAGYINTAIVKGDGVFWMSSLDKGVKQIYRAIANKRSVVYVSNRWRLIAYVLKAIPRFIYNRI